MNMVVSMGLIALIFYYLIQFARQEHVQEAYENVIIDVESRLDWARTRTFFPLGMRSQLTVSHERLSTAKSLWQENKWHQAYRVALLSRESMDKAQNIYCLGLSSRSQLLDTAG